MVLPQQTHWLQAQLCGEVGQTLTELYLSPPTQGPCNVICSGSAPQKVWRRWTAQQTQSLCQTIWVPSLGPFCSCVAL